MARRVFISVAEVSADRIAAEFARALRRLDPDVAIDAVGGSALREAGATVHIDTVSGAAMSWRALVRYREIKRMLAWVETYIDERRPDLVVCVDSWTINWRVARIARERGITVLYYVAPQ